LRSNGVRKFRGFLVVGLVVALQACAGPAAQLGAAGDIHAFLIAIRDNDQATFDAHVDRPALKAQLRARLIADAAKDQSGLGALAAALSRPLVDVAVDELVQPDVFQAVADSLGYSPSTPIPGRLVIAEALKPIDADNVCVTKKHNGPCILVFRNEDGVWRLTAFEGDAKLLRLPKGL
jgi:hypothetical protein